MSNVIFWGSTRCGLCFDAVYTGISGSKPRSSIQVQMLKVLTAHVASIKPANAIAYNEHDCHQGNADKRGGNNYPHWIAHLNQNRKLRRHHLINIDRISSFDARCEKGICVDGEINIGDELGVPPLPLAHDQIVINCHSNLAAGVQIAYITY